MANNGQIRHSQPGSQIGPRHSSALSLCHSIEHRASSHRAAVVAQLVELSPRDRELLSSNPGLEKIFSSFCTMKSGTGRTAPCFGLLMYRYWRSEGSEFTSWLGKKKFFLHNEVRNGGQGAKHPFLDGFAQRGQNLLVVHINV